MSVHRRGDKWQVRWWEGDRSRSWTFERPADAVEFDCVKRGATKSSQDAASLPRALAQALGEGGVRRHQEWEARQRERNAAMKRMFEQSAQVARDAEHERERLEHLGIPVWEDRPKRS